MSFLHRILLLVLLAGSGAFAQTGATHAEKLGWTKEDRVLILHMDVNDCDNGSPDLAIVAETTFPLLLPAL